MVCRVNNIKQIKCVKLKKRTSYVATLYDMIKPKQLGILLPISMPTDLNSGDHRKGKC